MMPGGVMCIVVPNEFNPLQKELTRRYGYTPLHPHHVNYFTPLTLSRLAYKAGFSILRTLTTFPMERLALMGLNYVKYPRLGKLAHWLRMLIESWWMLDPVAHDERRARWAGQGIGREIELWIRKV
jgi:hypothetical protein